MSSAGRTHREGPFWDAMEGRVPPPPAAVTLGFKPLEIDPARGTIRVQFEAKREFLNPIGVVQGGFVAAMLDDTLGPALVCTLPPDHFAPTIELKVNFIKPAPLGIADRRRPRRGARRNDCIPRRRAAHRRPASSSPPQPRRRDIVSAPR